MIFVAIASEVTTLILQVEYKCVYYYYYYYYYMISLIGRCILHRGAEERRLLQHVYVIQAPKGLE